MPFNINLPKHAAFVAAIRSRYPEEGPQILAKEFGYSPITITACASRLGVRSKHHRLRMGLSRSRTNSSVNIDYFQQWSPNMAYVLGYIWADGCVTKAGGSLALAFTLSTADEQLVIDILNDMGATRPVLYRRGPMTQPGPRGPIHSGPSTSVRINSVALCTSLMSKHNLVFRKSSSNPAFPEVPDSMMPHFARGNMDGDGTVLLRLDKPTPQGSAVWIGTPRFITGLQSAIARCCGIPANKIGESKSNLARAQWYAAADLRRLYDWMYGDSATLFLKRKRDAWSSLVSALQSAKPTTVRRQWSRGLTLAMIDAGIRSYGSIQLYAKSIGASAEAIRRYQKKSTTSLAFSGHASN